MRTKPPKNDHIIFNRTLNRFARPKNISRALLERKYVRLKKAREIHNMPGFLIDPSPRCPYRKIADDGAIWTDMGCCQGACSNLCQRYIRFIKLSPIMAIRDLRRRGINIALHPDDPDRKGEEDE